MNKLQIFSFLIVLSFFGYVIGMNHKVVQAAKPLAIDVATGVAENFFKKTTKTGASSVKNKVPEAIKIVTSVTPSQSNEFVNNQKSSNFNIGQSYQNNSPYSKIINIEDAFDKSAQDTTKINTTSQPSYTNFFSSQLFKTQSQLPLKVNNSVADQKNQSVNLTAPYDISALNQSGGINPLFSKGLSFRRSFGLRGSSLQNIKSLPEQSVLPDRQEHGENLDQSKELPLYRSPSIQPLAQKFMLDPIIASQDSTVGQKQILIPSWVQKSILLESNQRPALRENQSSVDLRPVKNSGTLSFVNSGDLQAMSKLAFKNQVATHEVTPINISHKDSLSLLEGSVLSDLQTLVLPDQSTLIVARDGNAQQFLMVGDTQGQFGLVLTASNILEFGFIDHQGQPSIITITDPSILLDYHNPGIQSLLQFLPAHIQLLLPKFFATQAVQNLLEVSILQQQKQLDIGSNYIDQKMITAPTVQKSFDKQSLVLPIEPQQSLKINHYSEKLIPKNSNDLEHLQFEEDIQFPEVTLPVSNKAKYFPKISLREKEKTLSNLSEDLFEEDETSSVDSFENDVLEENLNHHDDQNITNIEILPQSKDVPILKNLEEKVKYIANVEFNSLPKDSSRLAKIFEMLQKIQEMMVSFIHSIGAYDEASYQKQAIELAKKKAAERLVAHNIDSATWLDVIQQFIAEMRAILTSKLSKEDYNSLHQNNIIT